MRQFDAVTQRAGWHTIGGEDVFVLGPQVVRATDSLADLEGQHRQRGGLLFRANGEGSAQIVAALGRAGTLAGWLETMSLIGPYPRARFAFYISLVPALLRILDAPNFVVDVCGPTSRGKTTVRGIAASVWDNADETASDSFIINWDTTPAYRQGVMAALSDLPVLIDETRLAGSADEIVQAIYAVTNGRTRGRTGHNGTTSGLSTVLITTGEEAIVSMTRNGGARARCFSLWGSPFGGTTTETAGVVRQLNERLSANCAIVGNFCAKGGCKRPVPRVQ